MDFFERQSSARRRSALLILLFSAVLVVIALAVVAVVWFGLRAAGFSDPVAVVIVGLVTLMTATGPVAGGLYRWHELQGGDGRQVARWMGARPLESLERDRSTGRLLRVVEEIALAAGTRMPELYVLDKELALNAFAAGTRPANSTIVVTRGLLNSLDRDELQGVISHEVSHVLNSDTLIKTQLLAIIAGIPAIAQLGMWYALAWRIPIALANRQAPSEFDGESGKWFDDGRGGRAATEQRALRDSGKFMKFALTAIFGSLLALPFTGLESDAFYFLMYALLFVFGPALPLIFVGWLGLFVARVITGAVSRRREFLADAVAVQLTRNPDGLASALIKMHTADFGTRLRTPRAEDIGHMTFAPGTGMRAAITASHPSIEERLSALGELYARRLHDQQESSRTRKRHSAAKEGARPTDRGSQSIPDDQTETNKAQASGADALEAFSGATLMALAGGLDSTGIERAQRMLDAIPASAHQALQSPTGATSVVLAVLMHGEGFAEADQQALPENLSGTVTALRDDLVAAWPGESPSTIDPSVRLALVELALPAVSRLAEERQQSFVATMESLIRANNRISIFEFAVRTLMVQSLHGSHYVLGRSSRLTRHWDDVSLVLSLLAHAGTTTENAHHDAYAKAMKALNGNASNPPVARGDITLENFTAALERLYTLHASDKRSFLKAATACITSDGYVRPAEAELVRVLGATLDVPIPMRRQH